MPFCPRNPNAQLDDLKQSLDKLENRVTAMKEDEEELLPSDDDYSASSTAAAAGLRRWASIPGNIQPRVPPGFFPKEPVLRPRHGEAHANNYINRNFISSSSTPALDKPWKNMVDSNPGDVNDVDMFDQRFESVDGNKEMEARRRRLESLRSSATTTTAGVRTRDEGPMEEEGEEEEENRSLRNPDVTIRRALLNDTSHLRNVGKIFYSHSNRVFCSLEFEKKNSIIVSIIIFYVISLLSNLSEYELW